MEPNHFKTWEGCERQLLDLANRPNPAGVCFRGHANAGWELQTTLERYPSDDTTVLGYYELIDRLRPELETYTRSDWCISDKEKIRKCCYADDGKDLEHLLRGNTYAYMAHLRHHGFPSPILDWTASPYVAAYFAFVDAKDDDDVALFAFDEHPARAKLTEQGKPRIVGLGPRVKTHRRHFRQQSQYTVSIVYRDDQWHFTPHQPMDASNQAGYLQDVLYRMTVSGSERCKVLKRLDLMNINTASLFDTEDALLRTLAIRYIDLAPPYLKVAGSRPAASTASQ